MSTNAQLSAHSTSPETRCRKGAKETGDDIQIAPIMHRNRFPPKNDYCGEAKHVFCECTTPGMYRSSFFLVFKWLTDFRPKEDH